MPPVAVAPQKDKRNTAENPESGIA